MSVYMDFEEGARVADTRYEDLIYMSADFKAPSNKLPGLLPTGKLRPMESEGKTEVKILALEYLKWGATERSWPPYNEWALTIPVIYRETDMDGFYVVWMPVNHEIPLRGRIEGWGFNKFMADIKFSETEEARTCEVALDGKLLISFTVKKAVLSDHQEDYYAYNEMKGLLTRALVQFRGEFGTSIGDGSGSIVLGNHPIARQIASTGLEHTSHKALYGVNVRANLHAYERTLPL